MPTGAQGKDYTKNKYTTRKITIILEALVVFWTQGPFGPNQSCGLATPGPLWLQNSVLISGAQKMLQ